MFVFEAAIIFCSGTVRTSGMFLVITDKVYLASHMLKLTLNEI